MTAFKKPKRWILDRNIFNHWSILHSLAFKCFSCVTFFSCTISASLVTMSSMSSRASTTFPTSSFFWIQLNKIVKKMVLILLRPTPRVNCWVKLIVYIISWVKEFFFFAVWEDHFKSPLHVLTPPLLGATCVVACNNIDTIQYVKKSHLPFLLILPTLNFTVHFHEWYFIEEFGETWLSVN